MVRSWGTAGTRDNPNATRPVGLSWGPSYLDLTPRVIINNGPRECVGLSPPQKGARFGDTHKQCRGTDLGVGTVAPNHPPEDLGMWKCSVTNGASVGDGFKVISQGHQLSGKRMECRPTTVVQ